MSARATTARLLASVLLWGLAVADVASADRLDAAGRALRDPGIWVQRDLSWLVDPRDARSLARDIDRAEVPVRVAVLPQIAVDESRGDPRVIARAIADRAGRDGLYVLVDQDGGLTYAARNLPLDVSEYDLYDAGRSREAAVSGRLAALVRIVRTAPAAAPVSFEPHADPKELGSYGGANDDPIALIVAVCALLGVLAGFALHYALRMVVFITGPGGQGDHG